MALSGRADMRFNATVLFEQVYFWAPLLFALACVWDRRRVASWLSVDIVLLTFLGVATIAAYGLLMPDELLFALMALIFLCLLRASREAPSAPPRPRIRTWALACLLALGLGMNMVRLWRWSACDDSGMGAAAGAAWILRSGSLPYGRLADLDTYGPALYLMYVPVEAALPFQSGYNWDDGVSCPGKARGRRAGYRLVSALFHALVVAGLVALGRQAGSVGWGLAWACFYAISPALWMKVDGVSLHTPAALCVWAMVLRGRPALAGLLIGLASSAMFFPAFLIPLWAGWYRRRGERWLRFVAAVGVVGGLSLAGILLFTDAPAGESRLGVFLKNTVGNQEGAAYGERGHGFWPDMPAFARKWIQRPLTGVYGLFVLGLFWRPLGRDTRYLIAMSAAVCLGPNLWKSHVGAGGYAVWFLAPAIAAFMWPRRAPGDSAAQEVARDARL